MSKKLSVWDLVQIIIDLLTVRFTHCLRSVQFGILGLALCYISASDVSQ